MNLIMNSPDHRSHYEKLLFCIYGIDDNNSQSVKNAMTTFQKRFDSPWPGINSHFDDLCRHHLAPITVRHRFDTATPRYKQKRMCRKQNDVVIYNFIHRVSTSLPRFQKTFPVEHQQPLLLQEDSSPPPFAVGTWSYCHILLNLKDINTLSPDIQHLFKQDTKSALLAFSVLCSMKFFNTGNNRHPRDARDPGKLTYCIVDFEYTETLDPVFSSYRNIPYASSSTFDLPKLLEQHSKLSSRNNTNHNNSSLVCFSGSVVDVNPTVVTSAVLVKKCSSSTCRPRNYGRNNQNNNNALHQRDEDDTIFVTHDVYSCTSTLLENSSKCGACGANNTILKSEFSTMLNGRIRLDKLPITIAFSMSNRFASSHRNITKGKPIKVTGIIVECTTEEARVVQYLEVLSVEEDNETKNNNNNNRSTSHHQSLSMMSDGIYNRRRERHDHQNDDNNTQPEDLLQKMTSSFAPHLQFSERRYKDKADTIRHCFLCCLVGAALLRSPVDATSNSMFAEFIRTFTFPSQISAFVAGAPSCGKTNMLEATTRAANAMDEEQMSATRRTRHSSIIKAPTATTAGVIVHCANRKGRPWVEGQIFEANNGGILGIDEFDKPALDGSLLPLVPNLRQPMEGRVTASKNSLYFSESLNTTLITCCNYYAADKNNNSNLFHKECQIASLLPPGILEDNCAFINRFPIKLLFPPTGANSKLEEDTHGINRHQNFNNSNNNDEKDHSQMVNAKSLCDYLLLADKYVPVLTSDAQKHLEKRFMELINAQNKELDADKRNFRKPKNLPVTLWDLPHYIRIAEARAKMRQQHRVQVEDVDFAFDVIQKGITLLDYHTVDESSNREDDKMTENAAKKKCKEGLSTLVESKRNEEDIYGLVSLLKKDVQEMIRNVSPKWFDTILGMFEKEYLKNEGGDIYQVDVRRYLIYKEKY